MNARTNIVHTGALCALALITLITLCGVAAAQEPAAPAAAAKAAPAPAPAAKAAPAPAPAAKAATAAKDAPTYAASDVALGRALADVIKAGSREQQCLLITVVASEQSYSRDLSLFTRGDLAAGALIQAEMILNEAGAITAIVGLNSQIELMEDNSVDVFGRRLYVSYAHKATGTGIDEFTAHAAKAGFMVWSSTTPCNSAARPSDLTKAAHAHIEAMRKQAELKAEIAKR